MTLHTDYHLGIVVNTTPDFGIIKDYDCKKQYGFITGDIEGWNGVPEELFDYSPRGFHEGVAVRLRLEGGRAIDIEPANGHSEPLTETVKKYITRHLHLA